MNRPKQKPDRKMINIAIRSILAADELSASSQLNSVQTITVLLLKETITLN
jgi:hypothetical protein